MKFRNIAVGVVVVGVIFAGGVACFGTLGLWICAALLNKTAELMTRGVIACAHKSANKTDNSTTERSNP